MEQQKKGPGRAAKTNTDLSARFAKFRETARLHLRRWAHILQVAAGETRLIGPASFLGVSAALGRALTLSTLYSTSYAVTVDGELVGVVAEQETVERAMTSVERQGTRLLGTDFQLEGEVDYDFTLTLKSDLTAQKTFEDYFPVFYHYYIVHRIYLLLCDD